MADNGRTRPGEQRLAEGSGVRWRRVEGTGKTVHGLDRKEGARRQREVELARWRWGEVAGGEARRWNGFGLPWFGHGI
ncbi:hypothetical protein E2562_017638 [Oryza meyeriana var. granulata]|uniref:Uncharacterized protein n=1 Tax=Oryza meyeriana var. granulata TaxID=110450 RepID=A0A6G1BWZ5_9ORYZ|nr:hypothetical protein E2562_017638 [Oryza meyeriana var. granulata]